MKTPKEKAMQLYKSFYPLSFKNPKECALVCVDEILSAITTIADKNTTTGLKLNEKSKNYENIQLSFMGKNFE